MPVDVAPEAPQQSKTNNVVKEAEQIVHTKTSPLTPEDGSLLADLADKKAREGFQALKDESAQAVAEAQRITQESAIKSTGEQIIQGKDPALEIPETDPRWQYTIKYDKSAVNNVKDQESLINQVTKDYILDLTRNQYVGTINVEEAKKAYTDISLEKARQQHLVDQAKEKGEPLPPEITVGPNGKVVIDEAKVAGDSIKAPRIAERIPQLKKDGLEPFFNNAIDEKLINDTLARDPSTSYSEIRKMVDDRRTTENNDTIDKALAGFHVPFDPDEKRQLFSIVNDYRNSSSTGTVDEKVYDAIKRSAVEKKVINRVHQLNQDANTLFYYPGDMDTVNKIVDSVLAGKAPEEMIQKMKKSKNPTIGSTIGEIFKAFFKKIGESAMKED